MPSSTTNELNIPKEPNTPQTHLWYSSQYKTDYSTGLSVHYFRCKFSSILGCPAKHHAYSNGKYKYKDKHNHPLNITSEEARRKKNGTKKPASEMVKEKRSEKKKKDKPKTAKNEAPQRTTTLDQPTHIDLQSFISPSGRLRFDEVKPAGYDFLLSYFAKETEERETLPPPPRFDVTTSSSPPRFDSSYLFQEVFSSIGEDMEVN